MTPVEKMAARLLARHNLTPPYDLLALARTYSNLEFLPFPIPADGITIGIGENKRPTILINTNAPEPRKRFTLAHELGHIFIPWHTGTIVSHIDEGLGDAKYTQMESEANSYAAELLLPTTWLIEEYQKSPNIKSFLDSTLEKTGASRDATLIKVFKVLTSPLICAQISDTGKRLTGYKTATAPYYDLDERAPLTKHTFANAKESEAFSLGDRNYIIWAFEEVKFKEGEEDLREWRDILNQILYETQQEDRLQSINAILAANFKKDIPLLDACANILRAFDRNGQYQDIMGHRLFGQYVIKRATELSKRKKR